MDDTITRSRHIISLTNQTPHFDSQQGSITRVDAHNLPLLKRLSIRRLLLAPRGVRAPHWHANAHELGYCVSGQVLVTIALNHGARESFIVEAGDMFFAPSGSMHSIENVGGTEAELILAFSHERPEDFDLAGSFSAMSDAVLGNTYALPSQAFSKFNRLSVASDIFALPAPTPIEPQASHVNAFKYSVERNLPQIDSPAGSARQTKTSLWPALADISMFSVRITDTGMREPHWHPQTAEMGYVIGGRGRMTILDPDGTTDTYEMGQGDAYFIPAAYPHHIESLGDEPLHVLIFFDTGVPGDIGFLTMASIFPHPVMAAALGAADADLPQFPFADQDPLIVPRINPID